MSGFHATVLALAMAGSVQGAGSTGGGVVHTPRSAFDATTAHLPTLPVLGPKRVLLVIGRWSNGAGPDVDAVRDQVFSSDPRSLRSFVTAASGGKLVLNEARTLVADFGARPQGNCDSSDMRARAAKAITDDGLSSTDYDNLYIVVSCQGGANANMPGNTALFFGVGTSTHAWLHEFAHNIGIDHPSTYSNCPQTGNAVYAPAGCTTTAFSDSGDPVGGGQGLYPAIDRAFAGWLDEGQYAQITHTGLYLLAPLGTTGPNLYTVRLGDSQRYITLEYRQPVPGYGFSGEDDRNRGLWVRYSTVSGHVSSMQLDAGGANPPGSAPTLAPGKMLVDEADGVRILTCAATADGALFAIALQGAPLPSCTSAPDAPVITGPVNGTSVLHQPLVSGNGVPGATVTVVPAFQPQTVLGRTQVDAHGHWQLQPTQTFAAGAFSVSSRQSLLGRDSGYSNNQSFSVSKAGLPAPVILQPGAGALTTRYPLIVGSALPGARVQLAMANRPEPILAEATAGPDGQWAIKVTAPMTAGTRAVSARQVLAGTTSGWASNRSFTVSHEVKVPSINSPASGARVNRGAVEVRGTAMPGATVVVVRSGQPGSMLASVTADGAGNWVAQLPATLATGNLSIAARSWDNGLVSSWSDNRGFVVQ